MTFIPGKKGRASLSLAALGALFAGTVNGLLGTGAGTVFFLVAQRIYRDDLQTGDRRVRPRLGLRHGTPLASRDVPGERGRLSSCIWNLGFLPNDARKNCPVVLTAFTGWSSARCPGIGF